METHQSFQRLTCIPLGDVCAGASFFLGVVRTGGTPPPKYLHGPNDTNDRESCKLSHITPITPIISCKVLLKLLGLPWEEFKRDSWNQFDVGKLIILGLRGVVT